MASTSIEIVQKLLAITTNTAVVRELCSADLTYVSLNFSDPDLHKIMPWCGTHTRAGPDAIVETFVNVGRHWVNKDFMIQSIFGDETNVAVFGSMTYMARMTEKDVTSPFAIWCKFNESGKVEFMQFMEDTFATGASFEISGEKVYRADPDGHEVRM